MKDTGLYHTVIPQHAMNDEKNWALALSISGVNKQTNIQKTIIPGDISSGKPQEVTTKSYYHIPITLSFSLHKKSTNTGVLKQVSNIHICVLSLRPSQTLI